MWRADSATNGCRRVGLTQKFYIKVMRKGHCFALKIQRIPIGYPQTVSFVALRVSSDGGWLRALTASGRIAMSCANLTGQILHCKESKVHAEARSSQRSTFHSANSAPLREPFKRSKTSPSLLVQSVDRRFEQPHARPPQSRPRQRRAAPSSWHGSTGGVRFGNGLCLRS